jgi:hypothetical protein
MTTVFISYCHKQGQWIWERLVLCLKAGGANVLIDRERFKVGKALVGQMDAIQDQAEKHVLVLSEPYLKSKYCRHEMNRALKCDQKFQHGIVLPVLRERCTLPTSISRWNPPLLVDLRDDKQPDPWNALLRQCGANLGATAPDWLAARDGLVQYLERCQSVNLLVKGNVAWYELLIHITKDHIPMLAMVNLERGATASRRGLLIEILKALGIKTPLPDTPDDLAVFERILLARKEVARVALIRFDLTANRPIEYDVNLFASLRYLLTDARKLVLLVESRIPFDALLPKDHPLSTIDIKTIILREQA